MSFFPLQILLLIAVAYSQIFGGVSCCCLSRALRMSWTNASEINAPAERERSAATRSANAPKCPKCVASRASKAKAIQTSKRDGSCAIGDGSRCRCTKVLAIASVPTKPWLQILASDGLDSTAKVSDHAPAAETGVARMVDGPVRFGGRSWQSVACIWKN